MQQIQFVSGLPRSGSTLFQQIIGQNPNFYPTPTSGLINFFMQCKNGWKDNNEFRAEGLEKIEKRMITAFNGMFRGYFWEEINSGKVVFDKSRGWSAYIEYLKEIFQDDNIKVICLVRDVRSICASFEKLYRKRGLEYPEFHQDDFVVSQTVEGRASILLRDNGVIGMPITRLRDALRRHPKNIVLVPYIQMINEPKELFKNLHEILELPQYDYDFDNVKQVTQELDVYHGYKGLHDIKEGPIVSNTGNAAPWDGIFTQEFLEKMERSYMDVNSLATY
jgi:sulfotransferase